MYPNRLGAGGLNPYSDTDTQTMGPKLEATPVVEPWTVQVFEGVVATMKEHLHLNPYSNAEMVGPQGVAGLAKLEATPVVDPWTVQVFEGVGPQGVHAGLSKFEATTVVDPVQ